MNFIGTKMITVLSLFDGLGGARIALDRLGIPCKYYASEIDKYAIKIAMKNYPYIIQLGSVENIKVKDLPQIDLLIGGSPCQDLSIAKKDRKGLRGSRSGLFWEYDRLLKELKPQYFLLENVNSMKKTDKQIITDTLGVEPIMINSALLTAQNRKRLYWTNIKNIQQPEDKQIYLKEILDYSISNFYGLWSDYNKSTVFNKSRCIGAGCGISRSSTQQDVITKPVRIGKIGKGGQGDRIYSIEGKSVNLSANGGGRGAKTGLYVIPHGYIKSRYKEVDKYPTLCGQTPSSKHLVAVKDYVRKLSPLECERLQGLPDNYTEGVSNTQRYKAIGNGFTIPVIVHILKGIK